MNFPAIIIGISISMMFSAFFSGMEIAFVSSNRMLAEMDSENNSITKKTLSIFFRHPNNFVSTMLVGNNISLVIYSILMAKLLDATIFNNTSIAFSVSADTIISTLIVLFTGEFLPKTLFKSNPNRLLSIFAVPASICYLVLWPISKFSIFLSRVILNILGIKVINNNDIEVFSKIDLDHLVKYSIDNANCDDEIDEEVKIFQNALEFVDTKVRDCMIPRTEINSIDINSSTEELKNIFIESGNSKIVVINKDLDHVLGYIHSSEMFKNYHDWKQHINEMPFVPETMVAHKLMKIFLQRNKSLCIVVDEFGGTSGIVSLEDIVEEIFGDIEDEHDNSKYIAKKNRA
jgi:CBS domain containing-hemolysin-like protein